MLPEALVFNSHGLIVFKCMQIWRQQLSIWMVLSWIGHKLDSTPNQTKSEVVIWVWWNRTLACFSESNSNNYMWKSAPICLWSNLLLCPITSPCSGLTSVTQVRLYHWVTLSTGLILDIYMLYIQYDTAYIQYHTGHINGAHTGHMQCQLKLKLC